MCVCVCVCRRRQWWRKIIVMPYLCFLCCGKNPNPDTHTHTAHIAYLQGVTLIPSFSSSSFPSHFHPSLFSRPLFHVLFLPTFLPFCSLSACYILITVIQSHTHSPSPESFLLPVCVCVCVPCIVHLSNVTHYSRINNRRS